MAPTPFALEKARDWLQAQMSDGQEHSAAELRNLARAQGYSWRTVQRASVELGVKKWQRQPPERGWVWQLPVAEKVE